MEATTPEKHAGGRPLKFGNVKELEKQIDAYFKHCELEEDTRVFAHGETFEWKEKDGTPETRCKECRGTILDQFRLPTRGCILKKGHLKEKIIPTITGLALHLGCDIDTIKNYEHRDEFFGPIKSAYLRVAREHEEELHRDNVPAAKTIFALSNFGWKNPQHIDQTLRMTKHPAQELAEAFMKGVSSLPDDIDPQPQPETAGNAE
jgi:hypothetical protein